ncbi:MAG: hypothetical protein WCW13_04825 [archaeon]|jgi:hypothetical protein
MLSIKPTGQERVEHSLNLALKYIDQINEIALKSPNPLINHKIYSTKIKLSKTKTKLVFLSIRARDKVTRFYASNALKVIAQKLNKSNF